MARLRGRDGRRTWSRSGPFDTFPGRTPAITSTPSRCCAPCADGTAPPGAGVGLRLGADAEDERPLSRSHAGAPAGSGSPSSSRTGWCSPATRWRCRWRGSSACGPPPRPAHRWRCCCCPWSGAGSPSRGSTTTSSRCRPPWCGWGSSRATAVGRAAARRSRWRRRPLVVFLAHAVTFSVLLLVTAIRIAFPADGSRVDSTVAAGAGGPAAAAGPVALALLPSLLLAAASWRGGVAGGSSSEPTVSSWEMYDFPSAIGAFFVEFAMRYHLIDLAVAGATAARADRRAAPGPPGRRKRPRRRAGRFTRRGSWRFSTSLLPHIVLGSDLTPRLRPLVVFALLCYSGVALSPRGPAPRGAAGPGLGSGRRGAPGPRLPQSRPRAGRLLVGNSLRAPGQPGLPGDLRSPFTLDPGQAVPARLGVLRPRPRRRHPLSRSPGTRRAFPTATASCRCIRLDSAFPSDAEDEPYALDRGAPLRRRAALLAVALLRRGSRPAEAAILARWDVLRLSAHLGGPRRLSGPDGRARIPAAARAGAPRAL